MAAKKDTPLRLIHLEVENIKRLRAVSVTPDGNVIEITGRNKQGKTSLLDAVWWALTGTADIQRSPIRTGEETARIFLDLGELKITRKFIAQEGGTYTTSLIVEAEDGARYPKPQAMLDNLITELSIDPLAFTDSAAKEQFNLLKRLVPGIDFVAIEAANRVDYEARTDINRSLKDAAAQARGIVFPENTPDEPIDTQQLVAELEQAGQHNSNVMARIGRREQLAKDIDHRRREAESFDQQAEGYLRLAKEAKDKAEELRKEATADELRLNNAEPLPAPIDTAAIRSRIAMADETNMQVARKQQHKQLTARAAELEAEADRLTKAIDAREVEKQKAVAAAEIPVAGIGFGDGFVTLNGQPFDQASDAEQLAAAIEIAIAVNPRLRLVRVREGSRLDQTSWSTLQTMAKARDFQVLVETVESDRPGSIVIEDGMVANAEQPKQAAE